MTNTNTTATYYTYAIEGRINGIWAREHVGSADETTLFTSRDEAEAALIPLAVALECDPSELRVVDA